MLPYEVRTRALLGWATPHAFIATLLRLSLSPNAKLNSVVSPPPHLPADIRSGTFRAEIDGKPAAPITGAYTIYATCLGWAPGMSASMGPERSPLLQRNNEVACTDRVDGVVMQRRSEMVVALGRFLIAMPAH